MRCLTPNSIRRFGETISQRMRYSIGPRRNESPQESYDWVLRPALESTSRKETLDTEKGNAHESRDWVLRSALERTSRKAPVPYALRNKQSIKQILATEKRNADKYLPEPIGPKRMTNIIAPYLKPGTEIILKLKKRFGSKLFRAQGRFTKSGEKVRAVMYWTELPDRYTRKVVDMRIQALDLLGTQRLYRALGKSTLDDRVQMAKELVRIAQDRDVGGLDRELARMRLLRVLPERSMGHDNPAIPTEYSQIFSFLEDYLKKQFPNAEEASPFRDAFVLFWTAELLTVEHSLRKLQTETRQLFAEEKLIGMSYHIYWKKGLIKDSSLFLRNAIYNVGKIFTLTEEKTEEDEIHNTGQAPTSTGEQTNVFRKVLYL
ncbi:hypothetical protein F5Y14DRAFT_328810 [Nemania sp. NC0429]|nr:hypothetical protein F5Y14DRAFT_328810 [Nemania sp. NC0429]